MSLEQPSMNVQEPEENISTDEKRESVEFTDLFEGETSPVKEKAAKRVYTEEELNEKDPMTGKTLRKILEGRKGFKKEKTPEEKSEKRERKSREERVALVDGFLTRVINRMETLAEFRSADFNFEDNLKDWREAKEDFEKEEFSKAKKLLHKEMKHARLAGAISGDSANWSMYSTIYSTIKGLEET